MQVKFTIPESLADIKLKDYQKFVEVKSDDDIFVRQKMIQYFCNVPLLAVTKMPRKEFISISNHLIKLTEERPKLTPKIILNGLEYGFIPDLDNKMSLGEFIDIEQFMTEWKDFHKLMAVLYRPITLKKGGNYLIEEYDSKNMNYSTMLNMDMNTVFGAVFFFKTLSEELLKITPKYLQQLLRTNKQAMEVLEINGVGINTFTLLLQEACSKLTLLLPYHLEKHSYS